MQAGIFLIVIVAAVVFGIIGVRQRRARAAAGGATEAQVSRPGSHRTPRAANGSATPQARLVNGISAVLDRAVGRGQITRETADSILEAERAEAPRPTTQLFAPSGRERRVAGAAVEAVGYLGSVLALVGLGFFIGRSWDRIGQAGRIGMFGGLAALALIVGLLLHDEHEAVIWRLRNVVLLLSTASLAGCTTVVVVDTFDWRGEPVGVSIGLVVAVYSAVLWARRDRPAQHVTMMIGTTVAVATALAWWIGPSTVGFTVLGIGVLWLLLARFDLAPPRDLAVLLGLVATLIGPAITSNRFTDAAPAIGLAVAVILLVVGGVTHEFIYTGFAVIALLAYLTFGVARWFGDSLKTPGVLLIAGVGLLVATLVLVRRGQRALGRDR